MKRHSPCKIQDGYALADCPDRHPGCHITCEKYLKYNAENEKIRSENFAEHRFAELQVERFRNADKNRKAAWQRHNGKGKK